MKFRLIHIFGLVLIASIHLALRQHWVDTGNLFPIIFAPTVTAILVATVLCWPTASPLKIFLTCLAISSAVALMFCVEWFCFPPGIYNSAFAETIDHFPDPTDFLFVTAGQMTAGATAGTIVVFWLLKLSPWFTDDESIGLDGEVDS